MMTSESKNLRCRACTATPDSLTGAGTLFLSTQVPHIMSPLCVGLRHHPRWSSERDGSLIAVAIKDGDLPDLLHLVKEIAGAEGEKIVRTVFVGEGGHLDRHKAFQAMSLREMLGQVESPWLLSMLEDKRLTSFFQPIVYGDDPSKVFGYECLVRGRELDGSLVGAYPIISAAERANVFMQFDLASRMSAIETAARNGITERVFINFSPNSIYNPEVCLKSTVALIDELGLRREQVVFEVVESDNVEISHLKHILATYRKLGFQTALDDLGAGYSGLNRIHILQPDFIKLDIELIRDVDHDPYKAVLTAKLLEMGNQLGVRTLAEGVETEAELNWLVDHGAEFIQGYYIAKPQAEPWTAARPLLRQVG